MMHFAAIDLGASFIKSALVEAGSAELHAVHRTPFPPFVSGLHPSFREVDLAQIADAFHSHVNRLLDADPGCAGLLVSTQMHGFVLVDNAGNEASNFISWQDQRSLLPIHTDASSFDDFQARIGAADRVRIGNEIGAGHAAAVLFALSHSGKGEGLTPVPLPNALIHSGAADSTLASSFGAYDLAHSAWHTELLAILGLDRFHWPRITLWNDVVGDYTHGTRRVPIYSPIGDQQAALVGALLSPHELSINVGTGSQVSVIAPTLRSGAFKVRPWLDSHFLETVTHIPAGRALNVLLRAVGGNWSEVDRAVDALAATDLVVDLSFFPSAFGRRGRIDNIHEGNFTTGDLFLAAFTNMADHYAEAARMLFASGEWGPLVLSGGLAHRSQRLARLVSARLERDYRLSPSEDETLVGLACLAGVLAGHQPSIAEATSTLRSEVDK